MDRTTLEAILKGNGQLMQSEAFILFLCLDDDVGERILDFFSKQKIKLITNKICLSYWRLD